MSQAAAAQPEQAQEPNEMEEVQPIVRPVRHAPNIIGNIGDADMQEETKEEDGDVQGASAGSKYPKRNRMQTGNYK